MADTNETLCDIIAEKRRQAEYIRDNLSTVLIRQWHQKAVKSWEDEADRLDRARMKMEIEMANLRKENAKLREALVKIVELTATCEGSISIELQVQGEALTALATPQHLEAASLQDAPAN